MMTDEQIEQWRAALRSVYAALPTEILGVTQKTILEEIDDLCALARRGAAVRWRLIEEAKYEGQQWDAVIWGGTMDNTASMGQPYPHTGPSAATLTSQGWRCSDSSSGYEEYYTYEPTRFIPLSALGEPETCK
jgi:hypothetical protein